MAIFSIFFFNKRGQENFFYDIPERKNAFLGYKNKKLYNQKIAFLGHNNTKFKKSKNWHFSKGVNPWFWSKNGHFFNFFFLGNKGQKNVFLRYSRAKKRLSRL